MDYRELQRLAEKQFPNHAEAQQCWIGAAWILNHEGNPDWKRLAAKEVYRELGLMHRHLPLSEALSPHTCQVVEAEPDTDRDSTVDWAAMEWFLKTLDATDRIVWDDWRAQIRQWDTAKKLGISQAAVSHRRFALTKKCREYHQVLRAIEYLRAHDAELLQWCTLNGYERIQLLLELRSNKRAAEQCGVRNGFIIGNLVHKNCPQHLKDALSLILRLAHAATGQSKACGPLARQR